MDSHGLSRAPEGEHVVAEARSRDAHYGPHAAQICDALSVGIVHLDKQGRIQHLNSTLQRLTGWEEKAAVRRPYAELTHPEDREDVCRHVDHVQGGVVSWSACEHRLLCQGGPELWVKVTFLPVTSADSSIVVGLVQDIHARRAMEDALRAAREELSAHQDLEEQKDAFLSAVAHDLRTPLTTIKGRVQILRRMIEGNGPVNLERLTNGLERIEGSSRRVITLIDELLEVANIQIGRPIQVKRAPVDVVSLAALSTSGYRDLSDTHRFHIDTEVDSLVGNWDGSRLSRALANLLSNAVKYSPDGGDITVSIRRDGNHAILSVQDTGIGIPAEDLSHIFDRFHRGRNTRGTIPGTGIGLAAVHEIVQEHGGTIGVESDLGRGTRFTIRLPLQEPEPENG